MLWRPLSDFLVRLRLYCFLLLFVLLSGIQEGQAQFLSFAQQPSTCTSSNGSITVQDGIGTGPYWFYIDEGRGMSGLNISATNTYTFNNLVGGKTYYFNVIDQNGTATWVSDNFLLSDLAAPGISAVPQAGTCLNNDGSLLVTAVSGNGPFLYQVNSGNYVPQGSFRGLPSGGLKAAIQDANSCVTSTLVTIPLNNDLKASAGTVPPICEGASIQLSAVSNATSFSWNPASGLNDPTLLNPIASPTITTAYILTAGRGICPYHSVPVLVNVQPAPIPNAGADIQTCYGRTVALRGSGGNTYHWSPSTWLTNPNSRVPIVTRPDSTITYSLSVTDANGCNSLKPDSVPLFLNPPLKIVAGPDTTVFVGQPVQLSAVGPADPGGLSYQWSPGTGLNNTLIQNPTATLTTPLQVTYLVQVTTSAGCAGTDTVVVKAYSVADILVPNAFSPNNDGHNDVLRPQMPGIKTFKYFTIFDRWGRQVFTTTNAGVGWDGTLNDRTLETGVYVWMAMGVDVNGRTVQQKGTVVLVR